MRTKRHQPGNGSTAPLRRELQAASADALQPIIEQLEPRALLSASAPLSPVVESTDAGLLSVKAPSTPNKAHKAAAIQHTKQTQLSHAVSTELDTNNDSVYSVAVQRDGKLLVISSTSHHAFAIARYNPNGKLDHSFGANGITTLQFAGGAVAHAVVLDYSGTSASNPHFGYIVVAGASRIGFAVARFTPEGRLDRTFGSRGRMQVPLHLGVANGVNVGSDGSLTIGGTSSSGSVAVRLSANGQQDKSFGANGVFAGPLASVGIHQGGATLQAATCGSCSGCSSCGGGGGGPPTITFSVSGSSTGTEGDSYTASVSFYDSDGVTPSLYGIDWGDGSTETDSPASSFNHVFGDSGPYNVAITAYTADGNFTANQGLTVTPAVSDLTATATAYNQTYLTWTTSTTSATGIQILRSTDGLTFSTVATIGASSTSYTDTGLTEGTVYYYQVAANYSSGSSNPASMVSVSTPPKSPTSPVATAASSSEVDVSWSNPSSAATGFDIQRSTDGINFSSIGSVDSSTTSYADTTVADSTSYTYQVCAVDDNGDESPASSTATATTPLAPPTGVVTAKTSSTSLSLSWTAQGSSAAGYNVYRSTSASGPWTKQNSSLITSTGWTDTSASSSSIQFYQIRAVTSAGVESASLSARTPDRVGVVDSSGNWTLDTNGDGVIDSGDTTYSSFGTSGDIPVTGNWTGTANGKQAGYFRPSTGVWYLDSNGNGVFNSGVDGNPTFGTSGDQPVVGKWNGGSTSQIGIFRPSTMTFQLDSNGNGTFDSGTDISFTVSPPAGGTYIACAGDWSGNGTSSVALYDQSTGNLYVYDLDGNLILFSTFGSVSGAVPVVGDWNGDGADEFGLWQPSTNKFYLDLNGNFTLETGDSQFTFGSTGGSPVAF